MNAIAQQPERSGDDAVEELYQHKGEVKTADVTLATTPLRPPLVCLFAGKTTIPHKVENATRVFLDKNTIE